MFRKLRSRLLKFFKSSLTAFFIPILPTEKHFPRSFNDKGVGHDVKSGVRYTLFIFL